MQHMRSLLCRRGNTVCLRLQSARYFLPAIIIALNPTSPLAFAFLSCYPGHVKLSPASTYIRKNVYFDKKILSIQTENRSFLSSLAPSSSESTSTHGSDAVKSMKPLPTDSTSIQLLSFYRFVSISQPDRIRDMLFERLKHIEGLRGTVYVAKEGINAQFAVPVGEPLESLLQAFSDKECLPFDTFEKNSPNMGNVVDSDTPTFDKLIVRTRDCILRDGMNLGKGDDGEDLTLDWSDAGIELDPSDWDEQLRQSNIQLLDCRNAYESDQGSFVSAKPLNTQTFSETWSVLEKEVESKSFDPSEPVYIFCTGGIRCVKVGAYLRQQLGVKDVRSLRHGIIGYEKWNQDAKEVDCEGSGSNDNEAKDQEHRRDSLWVGENFLFDKRRFAKDDDNSDKD